MNEKDNPVDQIDDLIKQFNAALDRVSDVTRQMTDNKDEDSEPFGAHTRHQRRT